MALESFKTFVRDAGCKMPKEQIEFIFKKAQESSKKQCLECTEFIELIRKHNLIKR